MKTLIALATLAMLSGTAQAQQGYWTNGNGSIYGGGYTPQWHDTSNSGPIYTPPTYGYQQPSTRFQTTCVQYGIQTVCN